MNVRVTPAATNGSSVLAANVTGPLAAGHVRRLPEDDPGVPEQLTRRLVGVLQVVGPEVGDHGLIRGAGGCRGRGTPGTGGFGGDARPSFLTSSTWAA